MKTIIITGSNGLLGQKLVKQLLPHTDEYKIIATSKGENRISDTEGYIYESIDITNKIEVEQICKKYQPSFIINSAAATNVDLCEDDKEQCFDINVNAVKYLIEEAKKYNTHIIHLSTDFIFDGVKGHYSETDTPNPFSYYGKTKLEAEELLISSGIKHTIVRTALVYGVVEKMSRSNFMLWAKKSFAENTKMNVIDDQFRTPTLAEDLADGCIKIMLLNKQGIYNICGKDFMSVLEMIQRIGLYYGHDLSNITKVNSSTLNQKAKRPPITGLLIDKAINDLNYDPVSFEEGIQIVDIQVED